MESITFPTAGDPQKSPEEKHEFRWN